MRRLLLTLGILACLPLVGFTEDKPAPDKKIEKKEDKKAKKKEDKKAKAEKPRIAVFRLSSAVTELPDDDTFSLNPSAGITLKELVRRMK